VRNAAMMLLPYASESLPATRDHPREHNIFAADSGLSHDNAA